MGFLLPKTDIDDIYTIYILRQFMLNMLAGCLLTFTGRMVVKYMRVLKCKCYHPLNAKTLIKLIKNE